MNQEIKESKNKTKLKIKLGILLLPLTLFVLPADFFDTGQTVCISKLVFNLTCPGCGMSRAIQHALHFDFINAYHFNKLVVVVLPLLIFVYIKELYSTYSDLKKIGRE